MFIIELTGMRRIWYHVKNVFFCDLKKLLKKINKKHVLYMVTDTVHSGKI
jgi:hypothetical protein